MTTEDDAAWRRHVKAMGSRESFARELAAARRSGMEAAAVICDTAEWAGAGLEGQSDGCGHCAGMIRAAAG